MTGAASPPAVPPLHLIVDEASVTRVRGWVMDPEAPETPVFLRFRVNGATVWEGVCDAPRPDVAATHPSGSVGFAFVLPSHIGPGETNVLTIENTHGVRLPMAFDGRGCTELTLGSVAEAGETLGRIQSHIDSFRNGRIQGWVLRPVSTPEGTRLLGGCTVIVVQGGRIVGEVTADLPRPDVAQALRGEDRCGFVMQIPRAQLSASVFRVLVMPDRQELAGSPCVLTTARAPAPSPAAVKAAVPAPAAAKPIVPAPAAAKAAVPAPVRCAVCAVVRDEARDLPEWLAWQAAVGFDTVLVYENLSVDTTPLVLAQAGQAIDLRVTPWARTDDGGRKDAYQDCCERFGREFDWIAFLDADEFLVPHVHPGIKALLQAHENAAQVVINRAVFGSNGCIDAPDGLVIESFTQRGPSAFGANKRVKCIVRPGAVRGVVNEYVMDVGDARTVLADGTPVAWQTPGVTAAPANHAVCQLNHYFVRSRAHWAEKTRTGYYRSSVRRTEQDFAIHDRNEVTDTSALRFAPQVQAVLRKLVRPGPAAGAAWKAA